MRQNKLEIEFKSLTIDETTLPITTNEYQERCATSSDGSTWFFREFADPKMLAQEEMHWNWVNQFFPKLILERRTVYKAGENEKTAVGSCWERHGLGEKKVFQSDVDRLNDLGAPLALSILFFLNQSYSQINSYFIYNVDYYKIDRFEFLKNKSEEAVCVNKILIRDQDTKYKELMIFVNQNRRDSTLYHQNAHEKFCRLFWLELLNIALMPNTGWDIIFAEKQIQLRNDLLEFNIIEVIGQFSGAEWQSYIELFCRQFTEFNSEAFFDYRNVIIKNYCSFFVDILAEKIKKMAAQFVLKLETQDSDDVINNMDERAFHIEIIKSSIGKIYLNIQAQLESNFLPTHFNRYLSSLEILKHCLMMISVYPDYPEEIVMLVAVFQKVSGIAVNAKQLDPLPRQSDEPLKIDVDKFFQRGFAQQCIDWLKRTETNGLKEVLLNKNLLIYMYQRAVAQFKGAQPTSYPRFLSAPQPALPEAMEPLYQKIVIENNPDQLCVHIFELMKTASSDFWNLFMRQLAVVVFSEEVIAAVVGNILSSENKYYAGSIITDIQQLFVAAKVTPATLDQLNAHFKEVMLEQIEESRDSQSSGFRTSGQALFSAAAASSAQPDLAAPEQQTAAQLSVWAYIKNSLTWFK